MIVQIEGEKSGFLVMIYLSVQSVNISSWKYCLFQRKHLLVFTTDLW